MPVTIELTTAIRGGEAAAGDRIEGRLAKPILDDKKRILVPEGAALKGRLMRVERRYTPRPELSVTLRWENIRITGSAAVPFAVLPSRQLSPQRPGAGAGLQRRGAQIEIQFPTDSEYGVFHVFGESDALESGFRSEWVTARRDSNAEKHD